MKIIGIDIQRDWKSITASTFTCEHRAFLPCSLDVRHQPASLALFRKRNHAAPRTRYFGYGKGTPQRSWFQLNQKEVGTVVNSVLHSRAVVTVENILEENSCDFTRR